MTFSDVPYNMHMWAVVTALQAYQPETGLIAWWHTLIQAFQVTWTYGPGFFLFVLEPLLIAGSALFAQLLTKLKPKTIFSAAGLLLGAYMFFWLQQVLYGYATHREWSPGFGYISTMPLLVGVGQLLLVKRGFHTDWWSAFKFAMRMLAANYMLCVIGALFMPHLD